MPSCVLCNRTQNFRSKTENITFHRIPVNETVRQQWLNFATQCLVSKQHIKKSSMVCSVHFKKSCFQRYNKTVTLKANSVPSIVIPRVESAKFAYYPEIVKVIENVENNIMKMTEVNTSEDLNVNQYINMSNAHTNTQGIRNTSNPFADRNRNFVFKACQPAPGDSDVTILNKRMAIDIYNYCRSQYEELKLKRKLKEKLVEQLVIKSEYLKRSMERNT